MINKKILTSRNLLLLAALVLLTALIGIRLAPGKNWVIFFDNLHWTATYCIATAMAWLGTRQGSDHERSVRKWFFLGLFTMAFGQILWDIQVYVGWNPFPGPSDAFYLMLGLCSIIGLTKALQHSLSSIDLRTVMLDTAILSIPIVAMVLALYLPQSTHLSNLQLIVFSAYPVLLLTASCVALLAILHLQPRLEWPWMLLLAALIVQGMIWLHWNDLTIRNEIEDGSLFNMSFSIAGPMLGLAAMHWRMVSSSNYTYKRWCEGVLRLLPLLCVILASSAAIVVLVQDVLSSVRVAILTASTIVVLLAFIRQSILLSDREDLLRVEQALKENQTRLDIILNNLAAFIYMKDTKGNYLYANQKVCELWGTRLDHIIGAGDEKFFDAETSAKIRENDKRVLIDGETIKTEETNLVRHDGSTATYWSVKIPLREPDGRIFSLLGISTDISERKQMETALRESEERFRTLSLSLPGLVWSANPDGSLDYVTQSSLDYFDLPFEEIIGNNWIKLIHPEDLPHVQSRVAEVLQTGNPYACEFRLKHHSGEYRWHLSTARAHRDSRGEIVKWYGSNIDISELKLAEEKLQLSARVFAEAHEGITITDTDGIIVDVNPTFSEITGYSRDEVIGQNPKILSSGKHGPEFYAAMWKALNEQGHWQGEMWNRRKNGDIFAQLLSISAIRNDQGKTIHYVGLFSDITQMKNQQQALEMMAHYDVLTKLPNRVLFADRFTQAIARCKRDESMLAVCYLDLDGFKQVNDTLGHEAGDQLLIQVAERIRGSLREEDTTSRLGGDEFALLMGEIKTLDQCEQALARIHRAIAEPYLIGTQQINIGASSGVTLYPRDDADPDTLLRHADQAMYQAKAEGRNRYHLFDPSHDQQVQSQRKQLNVVEDAFSRNEFCLYYQPKVDMVSGQVIGAEALIRWLHPERGVVPPMEFLPVIEGTPFEIILGNWVIDQALHQIDTWNQLGLNIQVSVNISPIHLQWPLFTTQLEAVLALNRQIPSWQLQLEILESSAAGDLSAISTVLKTCRDALGVSIALDDFGTGYSSLTYLRRLPANTVKIDQSFVRDMIDDPNDFAIVEGVVGLAHAFRRDVIAEGVETRDHGLMLLTMGCIHAQGYGIARPMPADKMIEWIKNYKPDAKWRDYANHPMTQIQADVLLLTIESHQWIQRMEDCLNATQDKALHWPIMEYDHCHCGRWIVYAEKSGLFDPALLASLNQAHEELHRVGNMLMHMHRDGKVEEARAGIPLLKTSQQAIEELLSQLA